MNDSYEQIAAGFYRRIESIAAAVDCMAAALQAAAERVVAAALADQRIIICSAEEDAGIGAHVVGLLRRPDSTLPAIPALLLSAENPVDPASKMWQDLRTLARDGDILLCIDSEAGAPLGKLSADFAAPRNLPSIVLSDTEAGTGSIWIPLGAPSDTAASAAAQTAGHSIGTAFEERALRQELLLMAAHSLQEQIRRQLLGA